jgi:hypothetical protein
MREMPAKPDNPANIIATPAFNEAESPLTWLRSRRGKDGKPLISELQYLAGERLRMDFERAMLARRTTLNWDLAGAGARGGNVSAELSDGAIAARQRYHAALDSVGPELASMLAQVCCLSAGIEQAERVLDLPQRSGRAVLGLALTALARHYGLAVAQRRTGITGWAIDDLRPASGGAGGR